MTNPNLIPPPPQVPQGFSHLSPSPTTPPQSPQPPYPSIRWGGSNRKETLRGMTRGPNRMTSKEDKLKAMKTNVNKSLVGTIDKMTSHTLTSSTRGTDEPKPTPSATNPTQNDSRKPHHSATNPIESNSRKPHHSVTTNPSTQNTNSDSEGPNILPCGTPTRTDPSNSYHPSTSYNREPSLQTDQTSSHKPSQTDPSYNSSPSHKTPSCKPKHPDPNIKTRNSYDAESLPKSCHHDFQKRSYQLYTSFVPSPPFLPMALLVLTTLVPEVVCFSASSFNAPRLASYGSWAHEVWLEESGAFVVQWTPRERDIEFRVTARTTGYIGFGLSSKPRMDGADIVVGWVHSGKAYLQDRHGRGNREPSVDQQRDWVLVAGYENHTHTVLIMTRPYNTCDHQDHVVSTEPRA